MELGGLIEHLPMVRALIVLAALGLAGCGEVDNTPPALIGSWLAPGADQSSGSSITFRSNKSYTGSVIAVTSTTTANVEVETGTFSVSGQTIAFVPNEATCPGPIGRYSLTYAVNGDMLLVTTGSTILTFTRLPDQDPSSIAATLGCFSNGAFTAHELAPVSN
jgi:hypothetical protein